MATKAKPLTSKFVQTKGPASPAADSATRAAAPAPAPAPAAEKGEQRALSFRVPIEFFYEFSDLAHSKRISQVALLQEAFKAYKAQLGQ